MWEETGVSGENPRVQAGDHHTLSHTTTVDQGDQGDQTWVAEVRSECNLGRDLMKASVKGSDQ